MISAIQRNYTNTYFGCYNTKNESRHKMEIPKDLGILTGEYNLFDRASLEEKFSNQSNKISEQYKARTSDLPFALNNLCSTIGFYLGGEAKAGRFCKIYLGDLRDFYQVLNLRKDGKEYSENYVNEIDLVKKIGAACYNYANDNKDDRASKETLDSNFFDAVQTYIELPNLAKKRFVD